MSVILTQGDVRFGGRQREEGAQPLLLPAPAEFDEDDDRIRPAAHLVAVGLEGARGVDDAAVFALLYAARREATSKVAERAARDRVASPYDGTLRFGLAPKLGAALNDPRTRDELFEACGRNWRECADRPEDMVAKVRALWLQGTRGDCDEPQPHDPSSRALWTPWASLFGLGKAEARIRFIRTLHRVSPRLVVPTSAGRAGVGTRVAVAAAAATRIARGSDLPLDDSSLAQVTR